MMQWFKLHRGLKQFATQTHFQFVSTNSIAYAERYADKVSDVPAVVFTKADGTTIVELAGDGIPMSADALLRNLNKSAAECDWRRKRQQDNLDGDPEPQPLTPDPDPLPEGRGLLFWLILSTAGLGGSGFGVYKQYVETYTVK
jgi:hypothetical protein